ncbi:hypothetical protein GCM10010990_23950 [Croceicoccus mobilis]|uniref:Uncharacterized protein n=1 Tax=Croceicoccus mobilis TaxID=1703339 RepID=A0A917DUY6_9SPHN|nr:hypothetical protein GCM10010990_23950 [Croceicoccus mobilis]
MQSYRVKFADGSGISKHLSFQAANIDRAKERMDREAFGSWAWLWENDSLVFENRI